MGIAPPTFQRVFSTALFGVCSWFAVTTAACSSTRPAPHTVPTPHQTSTRFDKPSQPRRPPGTLFRNEVVATVKLGLGRFLERVDIEPRVVNGEFRGWRVVELLPPEFWRDVDLRPGDLVTRINGMRIEREVEAFAAFESLKTSDALVVDYYRGSEARKLAFRIVEPQQSERARTAPAQPKK